MQQSLNQTNANLLEHSYGYDQMKTHETKVDKFNELEYQSSLNINQNHNSSTLQI